MRNSPDDSAKVEVSPKRFFGANAPLPQAPDVAPTLETRPPLTNGRDAHRSPAARRARANVRDLLDGARKVRRTRDRPANQVSIPVAVIRSYYADWLADCDYHGQSPLTIEGKRSAVEKLLWFLGRESLMVCAETDVRDFLSHVEHGHEEDDGRYGARTARAYKAVGTRCVQLFFQYLRSYFKWLVGEQLAPANPLERAELPKHRCKPVSPLSLDEIEALLRAIPRGLNRTRNAAAIYLLFDSGLRVAELCSIRVDDLDLARRRVAVVGKRDKAREVYFSVDTAKIIRVYLNAYPRASGEALFYSERPGVFSDGLTPDGLRKTFKTLAREARLDPKRVSPHKLRHSFATEFLRDGGNARTLQLMLGHEDMAMTNRYVTMVDADAEKQHRDHSPVRRMKARKR